MIKKVAALCAPFVIVGLWTTPAHAGTAWGADNPRVAQHHRKHKRFKVAGGLEKGQKLYVCRGRLKVGGRTYVIPGKAWRGTCYIHYASKVYRLKSYEVLYATGFMWFPNNAQGRARATTAGFEGNVGMKVCMVKVDTRNSGAKAHVGTLLLNPGRLWQFLGKFHTKFRKCYFSYNNKTHIAKRFRLLFAH